MTDARMFIDHIAGLAEQGETALFVRQRPKQPLQYHADGACVSTRAAVLPERATPKANEAWYAVNGAFVLDRFPSGQPSWKAEFVEFVLFLVLDDVGSKFAAPPVQPSWIIETSPGSYQYGFIFSEQPHKSEFIAAYRAIADAGFTDPGAGGAARLCRIPGSVNLKQGRDMFAAKLVEWAPEREFTLAELCAGLGVTPAPADTAEHKSVRVRDSGGDSVLRWLSDHDLVLTNPNADGWLGVVCPNHAEHSDGNIEGRYLPATRAYCCYHGHCEGLNSAAFLAWVADNGGPKATPGLRDELVAERMRMVQATITPTEMFSDEAAQRIAEVERKELGRIERADWFKRFAYVVSDDTYFDMVYRREITRGAFNALFRHVGCKSSRTGRAVEASIYYDEHRQGMGAPALTGVTYAAGDDVLVSREGDVFGNRWRDARPPKAAPGDVSRWLAHAEHLIPDDDERNHVLDVMAYKLQHPREKINHAVLHGGDEGCGKDTLWAPFLYAVAGPHHRNRTVIDNDEIASQWGYGLESEVLVLNELREPEAAARRAMANRLKPIIAAPPETLRVNRKGLHPYETANRLLVLAFTNDPVPISLPSQDRRWCCIWSRAGRMDPADAAALWSWFNRGGFDAVARWLWDRDVSAFQPKAAPVETDWKRSLVENSMSSAESWLVDEVRAGRGDFASGAVAAPFHALLDRLQGQAPQALKLTPHALLHALKEAGWTDRGRLASADLPSKKQIFARADLVASKSELRRLAENNGAGRVATGAAIQNAISNVSPLAKRSRS